MAGQQRRQPADPVVSLEAVLVTADRTHAAATMSAVMRLTRARLARVHALSREPAPRCR
jgi:hypothetical protein